VGDPDTPDVQEMCTRHAKASGVTIKKSIATSDRASAMPETFLNVTGGSLVD
jgi:hypothetical protein